MSPKIALIRGDGIGPELTDATLKVLDAAQNEYNLNLDLVEVEAGDNCLLRQGSPLPEDTINVIKSSDACLKGPVGETAAVRPPEFLGDVAGLRDHHAHPMRAMQLFCRKPQRRGVSLVPVDDEELSRAVLGC